MRFVAAIGVLAAAAPVAWQARTPDIHYTPTRHAVADVMLQMAKVTPGDVVYDLGSGDGRIPIIAAQKYGARGVGIEIDGALVAVARANATDAGVADRVRFIEGNLFDADLTDATVITLYLSGSINRRLAPLLEPALRRGVRIVSHQFPLEGWRATDHRRVDEAELWLYSGSPGTALAWWRSPSFAAVTSTRRLGSVSTRATRG